MVHFKDSAQFLGSANGSGNSSTKGRVNSSTKAEFNPFGTQVSYTCRYEFYKARNRLVLDVDDKCPLIVADGMQEQLDMSHAMSETDAVDNGYLEKHQLWRLAGAAVLMHGNRIALRSSSDVSGVTVYSLPNCMAGTQQPTDIAKRALDWLAEDDKRSNLIQRENTINLEMRISSDQARTGFVNTFYEDEKSRTLYLGGVWSTHARLRGIDLTGGYKDIHFYKRAEISELNVSKVTRRLMEQAFKRR